MKRVVLAALLLALCTGPAWAKKKKETPRHGFDSQTGKVYPDAGRGGAVDPQTGKFYPKVQGGYIDPQTGKFYPSSDGR